MTRHRIAIVGMACRYPDANNPTRLWQTVLGRRRGFRAIPGNRLSSAYIGSRQEPDHTYVTHAGLLRDWEFDRTRFGIGGALYRATDETQWMALQVATEALADAGFPDAAGLDREQVGVVMGNSLTGEFTRAHQIRLRWPFVHRAAVAALERAGADESTSAATIAALEELLKEPFPVPGEDSLAGALANTIAGRICNHYDFNGTGYTVDGACASSLLAVMTASRALATGELDFALAGGVDLSLDPFELVGFARLGALADGEMRVYDAEPTGFLPGEGCGVVALMRAEDAESAGLRSYAHIVGWGTSSDGAGGLTRPESSGQARALRRAYEMSGVEPATIDLVEGHGTGTQVGDAAELTVLREIRGDTERQAALGSIKANIGHTKAAAGVAGLMKAALAVHHRVIPPTTGCREPHPLLTEHGSSLRIQPDAEPWRSAMPRASVSAMGFGGINTHVVLEGERTATAPQIPATTLAWSRPLPEHEIVLLGTSTASDLAARLDQIVERCGSLSAAEVHDFASTVAQTSSSNAPVRCALVVRSPEELVAAATKARKRLTDGDRRLVVDEAGGYVLGAGSRARIGLLFPGQAAPVRDVLSEWPVRVDVPPLPDDVTISEGDTDTSVAQPAIIRQSLAGLAWLSTLGCRPVGAVGHSLGEISALVWSGALTPEEGLWLAARRGQLMARHGVSGTTMAGVSAGPDTVRRLLSGTAVEIAGYNSPVQTTVAGPKSEVDDVVRRCQRDGIAATTLPVSHGFHSAAMAPVVEPFRRVLDQCDIGRPMSPVHSTVTGGLLDDDDDLVELLTEQLVTPVRFQQAAAALAERCDLLVEVGPGDTLRRIMEHGSAGIPSVSMDCGGSAGAGAFATAAMVAAGAVQLEPWFAGRGYRDVDIDQPLSLLSNPCEASSAPAVDAPPSQPRPEADVATEMVVSRGDDPLTALREQLGHTLELPLASIHAKSSVLGELHLNSLQLIELVATVASGLGKQPPAADRFVTDVTVSELAEIIEAQPDVGASEAPSVPGVRDWVRAFTRRWVPFTPTTGLTAPVAWTVHSLPGGPPVPLPEHGDDSAARRGLVLTVGARTEIEPTMSEVVDMVGRIRAVSPDLLVLLHHDHPAAAALARSIAAEVDDCAVTVVDAGAEGEVDLACATEVGYRELRLDEDSGLAAAVTEPHRPSAGAPLPLRTGDVCLVTGGTTGITAHCAAELATVTGAKLVVLGRRAVDDPDVAAGLELLRQRVAADYVRCDVTDAAEVSTAVAAARERGPIRGLLHGAGSNEPRLLSALDEDTVRATVRPKVAGLRRLLAEVGDELTLVLGFGSIIGRMGLAGQSEYCVANDWMRHDLEAWAEKHPETRVHTLEWSLWSDIGMGERLGVVDRLRDQGIAPITPEAGAAAMLDVLTDDTAPPTVMLAGRFPATATLGQRSESWPTLRFAEEELVRVPGVEAVLQARLSLGSDPYLDDHRVDGVPMVPAVIGLEAMAQAAMAVTGRDRQEPVSFTDVSLRAPITVGEHEPRVLRVAALADDRGSAIDVDLRDDADDFGSVRFAATVSPPPAPPEAVSVPTPAPDGVAMSGPHPYYGTLLFHAGRFRRLVDYETLSAFRVRALVTAEEDRWFSQFHGQRLLLGDPGAHDAVLHVLLACVPHRQALPVGAERVTVWRAPAGQLRVLATERWHSADEYVFDVDAVDATGELVCRWDGLRLRAVSMREWRRPMPVRLLGPLLSRRIVELGIADDVELTTGRDVSETGAGALAASDAEIGVATAIRHGQEDTSQLRELAEQALRDAGVADTDRATLDRVESDLTVLRCGDASVVTGWFDTDLPGMLAVAVAVDGHR